MRSTLQVLRRAGFFKDFLHLSDEELLDVFYENRKKVYSKIFGYEYDLGRDFHDQELARQDTKKMLHLDLEADVCKENKVYTWLLQAIDEVSGRLELITDIEENWEGEQGPILIRCKINNVPKEYHPAYHNDWVDQSTLENILTDVTAVIDEQFHICLGPSYDWFGQDINYIRLKPDERKVLQEELGWKFFDEFLVEMNS